MPCVGTASSKTSSSTHPGNDRNYEAGLTTLSFKQILEEMRKVLLVSSKCHAILDQNRYPGQDEDQVTTPSETSHRRPLTDFTMA